MTILSTLHARFAKHPARHQGLDWAPIQARLETNSAKLRTLELLESTGGEPDVVGYDAATDEYLFVDCAAESPKERRSVCYDQEARETRKEHAPADSAQEMAAAMGVELLTEAQYRALQELGKFDQKTSSWLQTPAAIRQLGGALFGDRRFDHVFVYHSGAAAYYAARGFRGLLRV